MALKPSEFYLSHKPKDKETDSKLKYDTRTKVTKKYEDKFGAVKGRDGQKRSLVFNKNTIQKLKTNYSLIEEIKIIYDATTNTPNTFNTFWKGIERKESNRGTIKSIEMVKDPEELEIDEDTKRSTDTTSIIVNLTPVSKEEDDAERPTMTNNTSTL